LKSSRKSAARDCCSSTKLRTAAARSAIALSIGIAGGLVVALASWASKRTATHASAQAAR